MAEARFVVFEDKLGKLREVLRHVRHTADLADQQVSECLNLGFRSLAQGEQLDSELEEFVLRRDGQALNDAAGLRPLEPSAREPVQQRPEHAE
ncbi:MAG TPA: hypothetical protein VEF03_11375 [Candidatus Binataceae bacterium]|nr:hypothetical protein [Candidatus Binataceae bacterium]